VKRLEENALEKENRMKKWVGSFDSKCVLTFAQLGGPLGRGK
jgi:hypothetical protein